MACRPVVWLFTSTYCNDSPSTASTAVSKVGSGSRISAVKPKIPSNLIGLPGVDVSFGPWVRLFSLKIALTPSLYHSRFSSIFFKVLYFDLILFLSISSVWTFFTCLPRAWLFSWISLRTKDICRSIFSISCLTSARFLVDLASRLRAASVLLPASVVSSSILLRRFLRLSLFSDPFW